MFKKKIDIIIDVETVGLYYTGRPIFPNACFNVGITAANNEMILSSQQHGIRDIWEFPEHRILDFYRKNFTIQDFEVMHEDFKDFFKDFKKSLKEQFNKHDHELRFWSYNADFDRRCFVDNLNLYDKILPANMFANWGCIMLLATTILAQKHRKKYISWCLQEENISRDCEFVTKAGNFKTSAQAVYRFITKDPTFIEMHKGKEDTLIEHQILLWCKKHPGWSQINVTPAGGGWTNFNTNALAFQNISEIECVDPSEVYLYALDGLDFCKARAEKDKYDKLTKKTSK